MISGRNPINYIGLRPLNFLANSLTFLICKQRIIKAFFIPYHFQHKNFIRLDFLSQYCSSYNNHVALPYRSNGPSS